MSTVTQLPVIDAASCCAPLTRDLTEPLDIGQPTVSHHLKVLTDAGFVTRTKPATSAHHTLVPGSLESVARLLICA